LVCERIEKADLQLLSAFVRDTQHPVRLERPRPKARGLSFWHASIRLKNRYINKQPRNFRQLG
jgi:hypothetical protein